MPLFLNENGLHTVYNKIICTAIHGVIPTPWNNCSNTKVVLCSQETSFTELLLSSTQTERFLELYEV